MESLPWSAEQVEMCKCVLAQTGHFSKGLCGGVIKFCRVLNTTQTPVRGNAPARLGWDLVLLW